MGNLVVRLQFPFLSLPTQAAPFVPRPAGPGRRGDDRRAGAGAGPARPDSDPAPDTDADSATRGADHSIEPYFG